MPHSERGGPERQASPRILFIDAYDSFSNNIIALVRQKIKAQVTIVRIDDPRYLGNDANFVQLLNQFDAVIAGPGPGSPTVDTDVGLIGQLWHLKQEDTIPVLGICLGFQSLALAFGARIKRLRAPRHGIVAKIFHNGKSLFRGLVDPESAQHVIEATQYNSLQAVIGHDAQDEEIVEREHDLWLPSKFCPLLEPLAWVLDDMSNTPILMAVKHISKPFWGIQFHPESICTNEQGGSIITGWWAEVEQHFAFRQLSVPLRSPSSDTVQILSNDHRRSADSGYESDMSSLPKPPVSQGKVLWAALPLETLHIVNICETLNLGADELVLLESATNPKGAPVNAETGRFSIIGLFIHCKTMRLQYDVTTRQLIQSLGSASTESATTCDDVWTFLKSFLQEQSRIDGPATCPFWGGLVGFVSYEACLDRIGIKPSPSKDGHADLCFAFIERSIVVDHVAKKVFVQSILPNDLQWVTSTAEILCNAATSKSAGKSVGLNRVEPSVKEQNQPPNTDVSFAKLKMKAPSATRYCEKVRQCQDLIDAGESYELCLTEQTNVLVPRAPHTSTGPSWNMYARIRKQNPAPFGAYLRLRCHSENVTILSSSPERFLCWDRNGSCQLRPIKGTVKKEPGMTRKKAEAILQTSKERAENLMIVDLIRHDLHGVLSPDSVRVAKLMEVEEYATVYQLVSVVEGRISCADEDTCGIDVLAASLPPGSMTGAPKKRSCELLQEIEGNKPRGIYSGVLGYLDVGGGGDFSVVIRTAYRWDHETDTRQSVGVSRNSAVADMWHVGAGGAVTGQSTDVGEWQEMEAKRSVIVNAFKAFCSA